MSLVRVSIQGALPGGEKWSVNPVFETAGGTSITSAQLNAAAVAIAALTPGAQLRSIMSGSTTLESVRLEERLPDGTLRQVAEAARGTVFTGNGTQPKTFQASVVLSVQTLSPGASGRGRLYWPATSATVDASTLRISSGNVALLASDAVTYLQAIESALTTAVGGTTVLCVWSRKGESSILASSIRVGDILDTQRRRRDRVRETYAVATI